MRTRRTASSDDRNPLRLPFMPSHSIILAPAARPSWQASSAGSAGDACLPWQFLTSSKTHRVQGTRGGCCFPSRGIPGPACREEAAWKDTAVGSCRIRMKGEDLIRQATSRRDEIMPRQRNIRGLRRFCDYIGRSLGPHFPPPPAVLSRSAGSCSPHRAQSTPPSAGRLVSVARVDVGCRNTLMHRYHTMPSQRSQPPPQNLQLVADSAVPWGRSQAKPNGIPTNPLY